ncbi:uncharacterized protein [Drosophila kikkawai]|uniref:Uncharacterized protein isoform X1 n=1 Tax=Drosophila kikkawai TaxID=30033 RepID=A0A6P4ITR4_DROKI|nr:uncharacterized protein LOC108077438 [Drosophila kikkawai]
MGAEQSALLACTQTGKPENFLELTNAEQFFSLQFEKMPKPATGPVTEALLYLVENLPEAKDITLENAEQDLHLPPDENGELEFSDGGESGFHSDFTCSTE